MSTLDKLFSTFHQAGFQLFLVGGAVRDVALGQDLANVEDLDFCSDALPDQALAVLQGAGFPTTEVGKEFGTVEALVNGEEVQVTTFRQEVYTPGSRHPEVGFGRDLTEDLRRRDFTFNALAMDAQGQVVDPFNGASDLKTRVLRTVSDPHQTFTQDPLRVLRAARFMAKLDLTCDHATFDAACATVEALATVSKERVQAETLKLLKCDNFGKGLQFMQQVGMFPFLFGHDVKDLDVMCQAMARHSDPMFRLMTMAQHLSDDTTSFLKRLKVDNKTLAMLQSASTTKFQTFTETFTDADVRLASFDAGAHLEACLSFAEATLKPDLMLALRARVRLLESSQELHPRLPKDLAQALMQAFDLKPSRELGLLKTKVLEGMLSGSCPNGASAEECVSFLRNA